MSAGYRRLFVSLAALTIALVAHGDVRSQAYPTESAERLPAPPAVENDSHGAATDAAVGQTAPEAAAAEPEAVDATGPMSVEVTVLRSQGGDTQPAAQVEVEVLTVTPPHTILSLVEATTDADGRARVEVEVAEGARVHARVVEDGRNYFAAEGAEAVPGGESSLVVEIATPSGDIDDIIATRMLTITELWEGYLTFSQIWNFSTRSGQTVDPTAGDDPRGLAIPLPDGAEGIHVVRPAEGTEVLDETVYLARPIAPNDAESPGPPDLIVRYSLPIEGSELGWTQRVTVPVLSASVVASRTTRFSRFPHVDAQVDVPLCADGVRSGQVCFAEISDEVTGVSMLEGVDVHVARGAQAAPGDVIRVRTHGWPSRFPWDKWAGVGAILLALLAGGVFATRAMRAADDGGVTARRAALEAQRASIADESRQLEAELADGLILEGQYRVARDRLTEQLAVIHRALRELREREQGEGPGGTDAS